MESASICYDYILTEDVDMCINVYKCIRVYTIHNIRVYTDIYIYICVYVHRHICASVYMYRFQDWASVAVGFDV